MRYFIVLLGLFLFATNVSGVIIDSIAGIIKDSPDDSAKVKLYLEISEATEAETPEKAIYYAYEAKSLSTKIHYFEGIGQAYLRMGSIHFHHSNYRQAMDNYSKAAEILENDGISVTLGEVFFVTGNLYYLQANYEQALEYFLKSLEIFEKLGNEGGIARTYNSLGIIYYIQNNLQKAVEYNSKSLEINEKIGNQKGIANSYNNIGEIYQEQKKYDIALNYYLRSCEILEETENCIPELASTYSNIGLSYMYQDKNEKALDFLEKAGKLMENLGDKFGMARVSNYMGEYYLRAGNDKKAWESFSYALLTGSVIRAPQIRKDALAGLSRLSELKGDFEKAYRYFLQYNFLNDSILKNESLKKITQIEMRTEFEKKRKDMEFFQKQK
ncbi:MAG: tetratricopeptide repeat protein, partial [Bacteroidetes bacterium]|nr:tetratricopeptide repeat protein [Bacteroidota bacterium]